MSAKNNLKSRLYRYFFKLTFFTLNCIYIFYNYWFCRPINFNTMLSEQQLKCLLACYVIGLSKVQNHCIVKLYFQLLMNIKFLSPLWSNEHDKQIIIYTIKILLCLDKKT